VCTIAKTNKKAFPEFEHSTLQCIPFHILYFVIAHRYYRHLCKADTLNVMEWVHYKTSQFRQLCVLFLICNTGGIPCWHFSISTYETTPQEWAYFCPEPRKMPTCETYSIYSCYFLPAWRGFVNTHSMDINTAENGYNDIGLCDISPSASDILRHQSVPHCYP